MSYETKSEDILHTWKEIGSHLNIEVRTCHRWENKYDLPVYRMDKSPKSRVYAYKRELDEWYKNHLNRKHKNNFFGKTNLKKLRNFFIILISFGLLIIFFAINKSKQSFPADFKISGSILIILDAKGNELGSYDTGIHNLLADKFYKERFRNIQYMGSLPRKRPYIMISDINKDNKKEILFTTQSTSEIREGTIICLNKKGVKLWEFKTGQTLTIGDAVYSNDYRIAGIESIDLNNDGNLEIIVISDHRYNFPTQLVILDCYGKKKSEYWNAGRLVDFAFKDINNDGKKEMLVIGMNNEHEKGCLIAFDTDCINGTSPQFEKKFKFQGIEPGSEKYYIIFPRTEVDKAETLTECILRIDILSEGGIQVESQIGKIIFNIDSKLSAQSIDFTDDFIMMHRKARKEGITSLDRHEVTSILKKGLLYFNGKAWVAEPSMFNPW